MALIWLAGFVALGAWTVRAVRRRRLDATDRVEVLGAAVLCGGLAVVAAIAFGKNVASDGRARLENAPSARARLFVRWVQLELTPDARIGYAPDAGLLLPRGYGLAEAQRGWDLLRLHAAENMGLTAEKIEHEPTSTKVFLAAVPHTDETPQQRLTHATHGLIAARHCRGEPSPKLDADAAMAVVFCAGDEPRAGLLVERDLAWKGTTAAVRVAPFLYQDGSWHAHSLPIAPGTLVQMGAVADAVPGLTLWELPAPAGRTELFLPTPEVMASCAENESACVLPLVPPFGLELRRLIPSPHEVGTRSLFAAGLLVAPAFFALVAFATRPRSELEPRRFARLMCVAWVATFLGALVVWRLLWAHRLDVMRRFESVGPLVLLNQAFVALAAAALAATAVLAWEQRPSRRGMMVAIGAWAAFALAGFVPLIPDARELWSLGDVPKLLLAAVLSFALGTASVWWPTARDRLARVRQPIWLAGAMVAAGAGAALMRHQLGVLPRLACAWGFVLLFYAGLRHSIVTGRAIVIAAAVVGGAALLYGDTGVALAVSAPGVLFALLLSAHDTSYSEDEARTLGGYDRHAPLLRVHALVAIVAGLALATWAAATLVRSLHRGEPDGMPARLFTDGALWLPLAAAVLTGAVAWSAFQRRERARASRWLALTLVLFSAWAGRNVLISRALATHTRASERVALVVDPAYALLSNDRDFQRGLAAWNETRLAPDATLDTGEGYFGARIVDAGVRHALDNDYLAVLIARESGLRGLGVIVLAFLTLVGFAAVLASERFRDGSSAQRMRLVAALVLGALCVYQPLAALGALPLTGIAWPGLGLNSPTDFWLLVTLLLAFACWGDREIADDRALRVQPGYRRTRRLTMVAQVALASACALLVFRAGAFALRRPAPLAHQQLLAPFESLSDAVDYVDRLHCGSLGDDLLPREILGDPASAEGLRRFHDRFQSAWHSQRDNGLRLARAYADGGPCGPGAGLWTAETDGDACRLGFKVGWPEVRVVLSRQNGRASAQCEIDARSEPLQALRPTHRLADAERIRLVSQARGVAAGDVGELIGGGVVVRLRPMPKHTLGASNAPGLYFASEVALSDDLKLTTRDGVRLVRTSEPKPHDPTWLIVRQLPNERIAESDEGGWSVHSLGTRETPLPTTGLALVVTGRSVWLFRPSADPLLADDVATAHGRRWRHYVYGGLVPELGWVNPYDGGLSLGLDGWVHVATLEHNAHLLSKPALEPETACGTLKPQADNYESICAPSKLDGVLECRVALQPELEIRLRHLLELASQAPELFPKPASGRPARLAQRAEVALLAGDTGEILARADFVPGRASTAYAPRTPEIEHALVLLREGRDPHTGKKIAHGEPEPLKADWSQRIAIGSTMKPLLAHAFERADPQLAARLTLSAPGENASGECPGGWPPLLGHCPPTRSIWDEGASASDFPRYLAQSLNWYQAAVGFLGTASGGTFGFGAEGPAQSLAEMQSLSLDLAPRAAALWTKTASGRTVISDIVDAEALRETPLWKEFEALLGRPLCTGPNARSCQRQSDRADLCAARALPIRKPSRDLRHLVALGPSDFDFATERSAARVPVSEYFQFLRGSGVHGLGSMMQLADAFNRLFYERAPQQNGAYRLAASWFPTRAAGSPPPWTCPQAGETGLSRGLCDVIAAPHGTAKSLEPLLRDNDIVVYGAKTGTIDALRDLSEHKTTCDAWNKAHTIPGAKTQPYQLPCGKNSRADINDSLFVIAFGVKSGDKVVPLLLALRFQGVGMGYATAAARPFIDLVREYFSQGPVTSPVASKKP
jgi:hypothetical protein